MDADKKKKTGERQKGAIPLCVICGQLFSEKSHKNGSREMGQFLYKDETYQIIGACFEVYNEKGCGFLEAVYQECLEMELQLQGLSFDVKKQLKLHYKGRPLEKAFESDLVCSLLMG